MNKITIWFSLKKLRKVEIFIFGIRSIFATLYFTHVISKYIHLWQRCIRVRFTEVFFMPICLGTLFHNIVPGIDLVLVYIIQQVERCTGQLQQVCFVFNQQFCNILTKFCLGTLVSLINYDHIPISVKYRIVFIKLSTSGFCATQILNGCKV